MADENTQIIKFETMQQKTGNSADIPVLLNGELGFAEDTTQLFIGSDPVLSSSSEFNIVEIEPFVNAYEVVKSYLSESVDYSDYRITEDLKIETGSQKQSVAIAEYINTVHRSNLEDQNKRNIRAIAKIQSNVEIVTDRNIHNYAFPADFNVKFGAVDQINTIRNKLLYQTLDSSKGQVFLEINVPDVLYINVEYVVIQDNGRHKRAGTLRVIADNDDRYSGDIAFSDNYDALNDVDDKIEFSAQVINNVVTINFDQDDNQTTKIFYRISRWSLEDYEQGSQFVYEDYIRPLATNQGSILNTSNK